MSEIEEKKKWEHIRKRVFQMVEVGFLEDVPSRAYDIVNTLAIVINLVCSVLYTFAPIRERVGGLLDGIEILTAVFFAVDYVLRLWTAVYLYPKKRPAEAAWRYAISFYGVVDLLSFLPYFLPVVFPAGAVAFRMFRVMRIFRLFRLNAYYDSLNVITEVLASKKQQLMSSVFIIFILMTASSLCMYSLEHAAQPDVFDNAFSGMWWATSTLLTVGYGDIYPVTAAGKVFGMIITFLGCGLVAIPTGIISAGFVEQYTRLREMGESAATRDLRFIKLQVCGGDSWENKEIRELDIPGALYIAAIIRQGEMVLPKGTTQLLRNDILILTGALAGKDWDLELKEIVLKENHPWNGELIRDLSISRQSYIVCIQRGTDLLVPDGNERLKAGDVLVVSTKRRIPEAITIRV